MVRRASLLALGGVVVAGLLALATTKSSLGPEPSHTGAPAIALKAEEFNCTQCHFDPGIDNLNPPGGKLEIVGLPMAYQAGQAYPLTVRLHADLTAAFPGRRWGFQVTAVRASDGEGSGAFEVPFPDTLQIVPGQGVLLSREYVEHTVLGTRDSLDTPVTWVFTWHAPNPPEGTVYFYGAAVSANGSLEPSGDFVFTTGDTLLDSTTPVVPVTWGRIKSRYR